MIGESIVKHIWGAFTPQIYNKVSISMLLSFGMVLLGIGFVEYYLSCLSIAFLQGEAGWSAIQSIMAVSCFFLGQILLGLVCLRYYSIKTNGLGGELKGSYHKLAKVVLAFSDGFQGK